MALKPTRWYITSVNEHKHINTLSTTHLLSIKESINKNPKQSYHGFNVQDWNNAINIELDKRKKAFDLAGKVLMRFNRSSKVPSFKATVKKYLSNNQVAS